MVDRKNIQDQLKRLKFGASPFNQAELRELPHIIHKGEKISELVNGLYEGGVALLVATEMRLLLIDKKPLNFLTVEDLRFDMINEIDYSHRMFGAAIVISTGSKTLKFKSYNQRRLRHLINLVQEHMSDGKKSQAEKAESQQQHLQEINERLQQYLIAQQEQLQRQLNNIQDNQNGHSAQSVTLPKPDPQLADYLFAQRLMEQYKQQNIDTVQSQLPISNRQEITVGAQMQHATAGNSQQMLDDVSDAQKQIPEQSSFDEQNPGVQRADMVAEAKEEIFGKIYARSNQDDPKQPFTGLEINPLKVAYSKLPMMLRNRKFGRPSFHAHSQQQQTDQPVTAQRTPSPAT